MEDIIWQGIDFAPYIKILLALLLGSLLGTERTLAKKHAGLRTFGLVSMGAALFIVVTQEIFPALTLISQPDLLRVIAGVVTGIGFLGAGIIIFKDNATVTGVTTAAAIWVAAGIGVTAGLGQYGLAIFTTVLTLIVFRAFWHLEHGVVEDIVD